ncbi:EF-P 5-aminopentanol modification-associated protein YfmH [Brevibacillus dissolubilis]|uniref:EF-P 5-aminopentanol modification-associated protein YfmH n=1 Tax=Brevibacillus dissolubilis TaxID=1844116 RepID=UPI001115B224|nr:pitrilysin family protein [Brevibacillus dissolubilis]
MQATAFEQLNETLYHEKLENGLNIYLLPKAGFSKTYAVFTTRYGSIDSHFKVAGGQEVHVPDGIAHFLEHKMFEKEDRDVFQQFSQNGASYNAFTSFNRTAYLFSSTDKVEANLDILLNFVQEPWFSDKSVEKEKGIIGQEIEMYNDNPDWKVYMNLIKALFQEHPVRIEIAGTIESISKITKENLYQCYETFYHPANMMLFVVGPFEPEKMLQVIRDNQGKKTFKPAENIERIFPQEPVPVKEKRIEEKLSVGIPKCYIGFKETKLGQTGTDLLKRELSTKIAMDVLFSSSSETYQKLYEAGIITESFDYDYSSEKDYAYSIVGGDTPDPDKYIESIQQAIQDTINKGVQKEDFERSKRKKIGQFLRSLNSIEFIANQFTNYKFNDIDLFQIVPTLESIKQQDVDQRLREHFNFDQMAVSIVRSAAANKE